MKTTQATVTGLTPDTEYDCYVITKNKIRDVCSKPVSIKTGPGGPTPPSLVAWVLRYSGFTVNTWTPGDSVSVCNNILSLVPGGTCSIFQILPGSVIVAGRTVYEDGNDADALAQTLEDGSPATLSRLTNNLTQSSNVTVELVASEPTQSEDQPTVPPTNAAASVTGPCATEIKVTWTPPSQTTFLLGYVAICESNDGPTTVLAPGASSNQALITGLASNTTYICGVASLYPSGYSEFAGIPGTVTTPYCKAPGQPVCLNTVTVTETSWTGSWDDGSVGIPEETYSVKCVALGAACTAAAVGTGQSGLARGAGEGNVTGLTAGTQYTCYSIATNALSSVCSDPLTVTTDTAPEYV